MTQSFRDRLADALLGKKVPDYDVVDISGVDQNNPYFAENEPQIRMATTQTPRQGGILPDMARGYQDNYNNSFNVNNLGQNKGWAQRIGEGLGTIGRLIDSPLGRGLIAAGLNKAMGYEDSWKEGLTAAVGRQNAQTADRVYRNQLMRDYGYTDEDLANVRGNIDSKMFNDLTKSQNSAMNLEIRKQTAQSMNKLRELQAEKLKIQNSNLPEQEKAKTLKMITEAEYAEQMQLAKINYFNNAATNPLGWANYALKADENERKNKELEAKIKALEALTGGGSSNGQSSGTVKIQAPNGSVKEVPVSQKDYYLKKGGKLIG